MCGLAGYIGDTPMEEQRLAIALPLMRRRGPDHQDARRFRFANRHAALLHSRLSIIDLADRAWQPFQIGSKSIVFNGELYNYLELRAELEGAGYGFTTRSDTEVLLRAIDVWGWQALDKCEGMWAFAIYDEADGTLTLCRDRFGEKPLYLLRDDRNGVYFGSEVKFLSALSGRELAVNLDHLSRYLVNGYKALYKQPSTFFLGVEEVPAGQILHIDAAGTEKRWPYWQPSYRQDAEMSFAEAVRGVRERLIRSVALRLRADVPLAFCMSGGVDSNALISIAKRELGHDVHGFTIVNTDSRYEEQEMIDAAVRGLGVRHTAIPLSVKDFLPRLRELIRHHDAPVYTISYYVHWLLEQAVAEAGYRISISGTAADEIFTGYYDHHLLYLHAIRNEPALLADSAAHWERHVKPIVRNPFLQDACQFIHHPEQRGHIYLDADQFAGYLTKPWAEPFQERQYCADLLRNRMLNELFQETVPVLLHEDDANAMYFSVENRSPFLDRALFEFANRIPSRHLVRNGAAKAVLREAVRGIAPDPVIDNRRKVGFNAPILELLDIQDPSVKGWLLDDSPIFAHVDRIRIGQLLEAKTLSNSRSKFLFSFIAAKMFLEEFGT